MKYILATITLLAITGCSTFRLSSGMPEMPAELLKECPPLKTIDGDTTTLKILLETVAGNYRQYHECASNQEAVIEWYKKQRAIQDGITK